MAKPGKKSARKPTRAAIKSAARKTSKANKPSKARTASKARKPARKVAAKSSAKLSSRSSAKLSSKSSVKAALAKARRAKPAHANPARGIEQASVTAGPARPPQRVAISHYNNADFESGLRSYAQYRDLGVVDATHGLARAHVLRFIEPCDPTVVSKLHFHNTEFQMVYVLKGWVKTELEGEGEVTMRQGSAWTQPPNIKHKINDYSEDAELLEVILPAEFATEEVNA